MVVLCGIWVQLWYDKNIDPRYALPIVLMASPFAALGLLGLMARLARIGERLQWSSRRCGAVMATAVAVIFLIGVATALTSNIDYFAIRRTEADVGRWVRHEFPAPPALVAPMGLAPIISYYAGGGPYVQFNCEESDAVILGLAAQSRPDVVVLRPWHQLTPQRCRALVEQMKQSGLTPVRSELLPNAGSDFHVLLRSPEFRLAHQDQPAPRR